MPSLEAVDLTKRFDRTTALDGASFRYEGGAAIGYLGPNGAGKTTTLKLFTGLLRATRGRALVNGVDVQEDPKRALWSAGAMIETPEPYPALTARESLAFIGGLRGLASETIRDRTELYAKELELPPLDRKTAGLSKGQRQRVVLAAVLMTDPSVLLLDEPTSGLDPAERVIIRNILVRLKGQNRLILMSSHLLQEVTEICDRVIFINQGKILLQDTVDGIAQRFRSRSLEVEFAQPVASAALAQIPGVTNVVPLSPTRFRVDYGGATEDRVRILAACQQLAPVASFTNATLNLEEAYMNLLQPAAPP